MRFSKRVIKQTASDFGENGFAILRGAIGPDELNLLQQDSQQMIDKGQTLEAAIAAFSDRMSPEEIELDFHYSVPGLLHVDEKDDAFHRINYPQCYSENLSLVAVVANPVIVDVAKRIVGEDAIETVEGLVFKLPESGREIPLHADCDRLSAGFPDDHEQVTVDIYLDDADESNGCLRVVPGSHRGEVSQKELDLGGDHPGLVPVPMRAGDVLLHHMRLLHYSPKNRSSDLRRTHYLEFQPFSKLRRDGIRPSAPVPTEWLHNRVRFNRYAAELRKTMGYKERLELVPLQVPSGYGKPTGGQMNVRASLGYSKYL